MNVSENKNIIHFLKNLIMDLENNNLSQDQLAHIGEFYTSYLCLNTYTPPNLMNTNDAIRFLTLGWYMSEMLQDNPINDVD